jgi:hypothetical protein
MSISPLDELNWLQSSIQTLLKLAIIPQKFPTSSTSQLYLSQGKNVECTCRFTVQILHLRRPAQILAQA